MSRKVFSPHPFTGGDAPDYWFLGRADDSFVKEAGVPFRISQANDRSGNSISISQATDAKKPLFDGTINGITVPRFNGTGGLSMVGTPFPTVSDFTWMIVASTDLSSAESTLCAQWQSDGSLFDIYIPSNGRVTFRYKGVFQSTDIGKITSGNPFLLTISVKYNDSVGLLRLDGVSELTGMTFLPTVPGTNFFVGTIADLTGFNFPGPIAEILIWKKALEPHKVLWYERYLTNYYAL